MSVFWKGLWYWVKEGVHAAFMLMLFVLFFFAGVVLHEHGENIIEYFTPVVAEAFAGDGPPPIKAGDILTAASSGASSHQ